MRVLVIEDDGKDARRVATVLADAGFVILDADSGAEGIDLASHYEIDAIALDLTLPDIDGLAVIRKLRAAKIATPILVLTADTGQARKVEVLNAGADDCVTKPFHEEELVARIHALVRRSCGHASPRLQFGDLEIDLGALSVSVAGERVRLTRAEYRLFEALALSAERAKTKTALMEALYGGMDEPEIKIVDVFVCKLRRKIGHAAGMHIETVWGEGYRLTTRPIFGPTPASPRQAAARVTAGILRALSAECTSSFDVATAIARSRVYTTSTLCALARRGLVESRVPSSRREGAIWSITDAGRQWLGLGHAGRMPPDGRAGEAAA